MWVKISIGQIRRFRTVSCYHHHIILNILATVTWSVLTKNGKWVTSAWKLDNYFGINSTQCFCSIYSKRKWGTRSKAVYMRSYLMNTLHYISIAATPNSAFKEIERVNKSMQPQKMVQKESYIYLTCRRPLPSFSVWFTILDKSRTTSPGACTNQQNNEMS